VDGPSAFPPAGPLTATVTATRGGDSREHLLQPVGGLALLARAYVAVDVGRERVGRVTEQLLDDAHAGPCLEQRRRGRVPQGVKADAIEAPGLGKGLEPAGDVSRALTCGQCSYTGFGHVTLGRLMSAHLGRRELLPHVHQRTDRDLPWGP
jgi:hypothetical protein